MGRIGSRREALQWFGTIAAAVLVACGGAAGGRNAPRDAGGAPPAEAAKAVVTFVEGSAEVQDPDGTWRPAAPGDEVPEGASVRTGAGGRADLRLGENAVVGLREGSTVRIARNQIGRDGRPEIETRLDAGRLLHNFEGFSGTYRAGTPAAGAVVRGTKFDIVARAERAVFRVLEGRLAVANDLGTVEVGAREKTEVSPGAPPASPQALVERELEELFEVNALHPHVFLKRVKRVLTVAEIRNLTTALEGYAAREGRYPPTLEAAGVAEPDAWGTPYRYEPDASGEAYTITSAGPDRIFGTEDDLVYRRE